MLLVILQTSLDTQLENLIAIALLSKNNEAIANKNDLAQGCKDFIAKNYNRYFSESSLNPDLEMRLVTKLEECSKLSSIFRDGVASRIDDLNQSSAIEFEVVAEEQTKKKEIIEGGLALLNVLSSDHHLIAELIVTDIVILPSAVAYGGSTSDGLGIIWANPNLNWRSADAVEFMVHELTHQCMFVDEICNTHYNYKILMQPENWAQSAILHKHRPVDKVLHSIVVATELLLFRERIGHPASSRAHPPTTKLIQQINSSVSSLKEVSQRQSLLLTDRAREILENCVNHVKSIESACELEI